MSVMDEQMIEPCPFCGEVPRRWQNTQVVSHSVSDCPIDGRNYNLEQWNRRAAHSVIAGKVAEHVTCDEAIQVADEAVDRCADGYDAKLLTISALVEGLHAQLFGIASLNDPAASHEAIADNGVIHEAVHALVRELPARAALAPYPKGAE